MKNIPLYDVRKIEDLKQMLYSSVELYKNKTAFLVKNKSTGNYEPITYQQFKNDVDALGTALVAKGLKDKRIAIIGENRYEWGVSYLAVLGGTGIVVPIDKELPENEILSLLERAEASAVVFSGSKRDIIKKVAAVNNKVDYFIDMDSEEDTGKFLSYAKLLNNGRKLVENGDNSFIEAKIDTEAMNIILFTSATTDTSKAVKLSHKNICTNLMAMSSMLYVDPSDVFLSVLPMHHTYECTCGFLCPIYRGASIAFCEGLRHIAKNLKEAKATMMLGVPLIYESMYKKVWDQAAKTGMDKKLKTAIKINNFTKKLGIDLGKKLFKKIHDNLGGHIRIFISGAAGIDPAVAKGFRDLGIQLVQGYGLTECAPIVALNRDVDFKDDAAGLPLPGLSVAIHNPNEEGIGEIKVKGPSVMLGYYEDDESNSRVFIDDGWFLTGDLGYIDSDNFVHITGRKKNVIVTKNGKNIYPEEIETLLGRSNYIQECMVYGKDLGDEVTVAASIFPNYEKIKEEFGDISEGEIKKIVHDEIKSVNKGLVTYKHIKDFSIRGEEFIKTTTRKIKRYMERIK
ncbi:MAG TPA: AMP-binding protein [Clostridiaceae bacterium]|nr:AMP-binding protein [Clostridiaceae bacterium]